MAEMTNLSSWRWVLVWFGALQLRRTHPKVPRQPLTLLRCWTLSLHFRPMQRIVLVFLMLLLPVQWTWAAAASICRHEASIHANHFGHHEHRHDQQASEPASVDVGGSADDSKAQGDFGAHADCASCHGAVSAVVMQATVVLSAPMPPSASTPYQRSVTTGLPERLIRPPHVRLA